MHDAVRPALAILLIVALAGCGFLAADPTPGPAVVEHADPYPANPMGEWDAELVVGEGGAPPAEPVGVADAIALGPGAPVRVGGALFVDDAYGEVWLCSEIILDGDAPGARCGGTILRVDSTTRGAGMTAEDHLSSLLAGAEVGELETADTVRWTAEALLVGTIR